MLDMSVTRWSASATKSVEEGLSIFELPNHCSEQTSSTHHVLERVRREGGVKDKISGFLVCGRHGSARKSIWTDMDD